MASRRDLIEAEDFHRRRGVAALARGDTLEVEQVPRRPNVWLITGVVVALLIAAGSAATAFITDRAPDGWLDNGTLVINEDTGARYVAQGGRLHAASTLTGAILAGAKPEPVLVPTETLRQAPIGRPLRPGGLPERPPDLPAVPTGFTACATGPNSVDVFAGAPAVALAPANGLLVQARGTSQIVLLAGRRAYPITPDALVALGYSRTQVRSVPGAWLELTVPGPRLTVLRPDGRVVEAADTGRRFVVDGATVRPLVNRTSALLAPSPVRTVPDSVLLSRPSGPPVGIAGAPATAPNVPAPNTSIVACVRSSDGLVTVAAAVADAGTRPSPPHRVRIGSATVTVTWHFPPGQGALVGPLNLDQPQPSGPDDITGIRLVAGGVGYPVASLEVLRELGYQRQQTVLLPDSWLALLEPGTTLTKRP